MTTQNLKPCLTLAEFLESLYYPERVAIDTETLDMKKYDVRDGTGWAIGISAAYYIPGYGIVSNYFPFRHGDGEDLDLDVLDELKKWFTQFKGTIYFHNAKFDLESLKTLGINYTGRFKCTMLMAHLINENYPFSKSLDACTQHYLNDAGKKRSEEFEAWIKYFGWPDPNGKMMPTSMMAEYAAYDADLTLRLGEHLESFFKGLNDYWTVQKEPFVRLIAQMERNGVKVDTELCKRQIVIGEYQMGEILEILGYDNLGPIALSDLLFKRLKLPVVKQTKTGAPCFDKEAMGIYDQILERSDNETAQHVLSYRGWQKSVSSNYRPYLELLSPDGRLRPNYKLHGTKTGRLSCERPNLQQIPRVSDKPWNGQMKAAFVPDSGFELWEYDFAQLELRLATAYAGEIALIEAFEAGRDVFIEMSEQIGMPRHDTKTLVYTIQYGGGVKRLTHVFGISPDRAAEIRDNFYNTYPGFRRISNLAANRVKAGKPIKVWSGRYRHFQFGKDEAHKAFNSAIQGGAADIMERAMLRVTPLVSDECRMLLQIHDSIVVEIRSDRVEYYVPLIKQAMEAVPEPFGVKFAVDAKKWGSK
jgi:DNA polymerase I